MIEIFLERTILAVHKYHLQKRRNIMLTLPAQNLLIFHNILILR